MPATRKVWLDTADEAVEYLRAKSGPLCAWKEKYIRKMYAVKDHAFTYDFLLESLARQHAVRVASVHRCKAKRRQIKHDICKAEKLAKRDREERPLCVLPSIYDFLIRECCDREKTEYPERYDTDMDEEDKIINVYTK